MTDDAAVRAFVYDTTMRTGAPPSVEEIARGVDATATEAAESLQRLAAGRALVLQPASGEVLMANPFSAVPTPFPVESGGVRYYGNCIWDALGIPAVLKRDAVIETSCADCGAAMRVRVERGAAAGEGLIHFAIPARKWWNDIVFT